MNSLNPIMRIYKQIADAIESHEGKQNKRELKERILNLLSMVGLPSRVYSLYPHELSGGMKQRATMAIAVALRPRVIIADEPTTAIDVTTQAQVLNLLKQLQVDLGLSYLFITHNISVVAYLAHEVAVMYLGKIVEQGTMEEIFDNPSHPYTRGLMGSTVKG